MISKAHHEEGLRLKVGYIVDDMWMLSYKSIYKTVN